MPKKTPSINYTSRDFNSIKDDLVEYAKRYYPDTYRDFTEPSFGSLVMDSVAYVGDILSFYVDYQANESFLSTAIEYDNIVKLSNQLGYKYQPNASSFGTLHMFALIPIESNTIAPDTNYMPILRKGSKFTSLANSMYTLIEDVDFSKAGNEIVVAQVDATSGAPTAYAVRAAGTVMSGELMVKQITIGAFEKFLKVKVPGQNISEIVSITDDNGNVYYEVDYLSQNIIHVPVANNGANRATVPNILKAISVQRRFVVERDQSGTYLQFGYGSEESPVRLEEPSNIILDLHGKDYSTDKSFDPSVLGQTNKLGVTPSNTTLTVIFRVNTSANANAAARTLVNVFNAVVNFDSPEALTAAKKNFVINSLEVINEDAIVGDVSLPTSDELKQRAYSSFATQNRAVTRQDYISMIYRMPAKFGSVKRATLIQDRDSFNQRNLNIYVVSEDTSGDLVASNSVLKTNLKTWVEQYKMINDTVDILDAKIVNIGIDFVAVAASGVNKSDALTAATNSLRLYYVNQFDIGEPIMITDIYRILNGTTLITDTVSVKVVVKSGTNYSDNGFDALRATSADGRMVTPSSDMIFEIKDFFKDITGTIR
tara:strand:- start:524 stop:2314 length:1791 start_codon:yes stop_codon:yes gene_type:complete